MMRRRPVMRPRRSLLGTMATTAVVAGTATAVSGAVAGHQRGKQQAAAAEAAESQQMAEMQQQMDALQAQQAAAAVPAAPAAAAAAPTDPMMQQLEQLGQMHAQGLLTDEEFAAAKAKLLAG
jgi:hypothetical protein